MRLIELRRVGSLSTRTTMPGCPGLGARCVVEVKILSEQSFIIKGWFFESNGAVVSI
jgi:hypothetical protein